jgi:hypothetical protein
MIFIKEFAESNVVLIKYIISIAENAIALKDFILFKELAQDA